MKHITVTFDYEGPVPTHAEMEDYLNYWLHENGHWPMNVRIQSDSIPDFLLASARAKKVRGQ